MANHTKRRGLEAADALPATALERGVEFDAFLRRELKLLAHSGEQVPAPRQLFYDLSREEQRPLSMARVGQALQAIALSPLISDGRFFALAEHVAGWIRSLRPGVCTSLQARWEQETLAQADADVSQAKAISAIDRRDIAALDAAIAETSEHLGEQQRLLASYITARRALLAQRHHRGRVLAGMGVA